MTPSLVATDACAWPVIHRLQPGVLGLVFFNRPSHGLVEGDLAALVSRDDGATWTEAGLPAPHDPGANRMHLAVGTNHAGRWLVFSTGFRVADGKYVSLQPLWLSTCTAPGGPWEVRRDVEIEGLAPFAIPHGRILALPDGRLAATFYRSEGRGNPSRTWVAFSRDGGESWSGTREFGDGDANEGVLLARTEDDWLAVVRTHVDHHLALYASLDAGTNWSLRRELTLPMQHPGDLTDLGEGRILLTYGIRNRGLMGIGARLSRDGGATWGAPVVLYQFGEAGDCGYPSTVRCDDGALLTACYSDLSSLYRGYHLLTLRWRPEEFFTPRQLRSISDLRPLEA